MEDRGLLFIPDISGFTRFVNQVEIRHSRLIIQELLEVVINANQLGLEVSEIEGDAILFYRFGDSPELPKIYQQVEQMFLAFHRHLVAYEHRRLCQCTACASAINLTLKVITHYGEFTGYHVRNFNKLIGKDVIVAHQLLKNDIDQHEYWLVTDTLLHEDPPDLAQWMQWMSSTRRTEEGEIPFHYTQLGPLKDEVPPDPPLDLELPGKMKMVSTSRVYDMDLLNMLHITCCFDYRHRWQAGTKGVSEVDYQLPRIGNHYKCILERSEEKMVTSSFSFHPNHVVFSETDEKKKSAVYFVLEKVSDNKTKLTLEYYLDKNVLSNLLFSIAKKKKVAAAYEESMTKLVDFVQEMQSGRMRRE